MTDAGLIRWAGRALYVRDFVNCLASDLGVSPRTVRRWLSEEAPVPPGVWVELEQILPDSCKSLLKEIRQRTGRNSDGS